MEYVGRLPDEIFGTIHGPGYAGGASFGNVQEIEDVAADYHTYAVEWEPDLIKWYVDGVLYHSGHPGRRGTATSGCSTTRSSCCSTWRSVATSAARSAMI